MLGINGVHYLYKYDPHQEQQHQLQQAKNKQTVPHYLKLAEKIKNNRQKSFRLKILDSKLPWSQYNGTNVSKVKQNEHRVFSDRKQFMNQNTYEKISSRIHVPMFLEDSVDLSKMKQESITDQKRKPLSTRVPIREKNEPNVQRRTRSAFAQRTTTNGEGTKEGQLSLYFRRRMRIGLPRSAVERREIAEERLLLLKRRLNRAASSENESCNSTPSNSVTHSPQSQPQLLKRRPILVSKQTKNKMNIIKSSSKELRESHESLKIISNKLTRRMLNFGNHEEKWKNKNEERMENEDTNEDSNEESYNDAFEDSHEDTNEDTNKDTNEDSNEDTIVKSNVPSSNLNRDEVPVKPLSQNIELEERPTEFVERRPCPICNRKFAVNRLEKHVQACKKAKKKRKVMDMKKKMIPEEAQQIAKKEDKHVKKKPKIPKWKIERQQLREALRAMKSGAKLQPIPEEERIPDEVLDTREKCPSCGRKFNSDVLKRHIQYCQNTKHKPTSLKRGSGRAGGKYK